MRIDVKLTGFKIRKALKDKGYSGKDLSELLCISDSSVYHWLNGDTLPKVEYLYEISKLVNKSMDELIVEKVA